MYNSKQNSHSHSSAIIFRRDLAWERKYQVSTTQTTGSPHFLFFFFLSDALAQKSDELLSILIALMF